MTHEEMAKGLLRQAEASLASARQATEDGNWAFAVRTSQDASELSLKALLLTAGEEPPKIHDLGGVLEKSKGRLGELGLDPGEVAHLAETAHSLAEDRLKALYGDEERDIPASRIYQASDAREAVEAAEKVHEECRRIVEAWF